MLGKDYKQEMDTLFPRPEALHRLDALVSGQQPARAGISRFRFGRRMVLAAALCAVLMASAVAAGPTLWETLQEHLGLFSPLAAQAEGSVTDQGVEVRLVGSLSDGYEARVYFTATDRIGGRFNDHTRVSAELKGELAGMGSVLGCQVLSYARDAKQLLVEASLEGLDSTAPLTLEVSAFDSASRTMQTELPRPENIPAAPTTTVNGTVILLPDEDAQELAEGVFLSSMGFDTDGLFHIRIDYGEGYQPGRWLAVIPQSHLRPDSTYYEENCIRTELEHGIDLAYPRLTRAVWDDVSGFYVSGGYSGPDAVIRGTWQLPAALTQVEKRVLDVEQKVGEFQVQQIEVSQMSVVATYQRLDPQSSWMTNVQLFDKNGDQVPMTIGLCTIKDDLEDIVYTRWTLEEPVDLKDLAYVMVGGVPIPLN